MFYFVNRTTNKVKSVHKGVQQPSNGFRVVNVPNYVDVDDKDVSGSPPAFQYTDLIDQKYAGILASNPQYEGILYDDLDDASAFDLTDPLTRGGTGGDVFWLNDTNGYLKTNPVDPGGSFVNFAVYWDIFKVTRTESDFRNKLVYQEVDPDTIEVYLSNDNSSFQQVTQLENIVLGSTGTQVTIRLENTTSDRIYLGGYGILFG